MVIPINPSSIPDNTGVPPNKLRVDQLQKVAPVALNDQVITDPKAAVSFALAASQAEDPAAAKYALANPGLIAHTDAELVALQSQANLAQIAKQASQNPLTPDLAKLLNSVGDPNDPSSLVTQWPDEVGNTKQPPSDNPLRQNLQAIYQNLTRSPMFAAQALATLLGPRLGQGSIDDKNQELIAKVRDLMQSISGDSPYAKEGARLLMHGILNWQGEFLPGLKGSIRREDIWEKDPKHEGQMLRGSKITMEMNLPQSGTFKVVGVQFQDIVNLTIEPPEPFKGTFMAQRNDLELRLKEQVPFDVHYQMAKGSSAQKRDGDE
jgi:hypothetical protein